MGHSNAIENAPESCCSKKSALASAKYCPELSEDKLEISALVYLP